MRVPYLYQIGLPGGSLQNTGQWQCQCLWHEILGYLHKHFRFNYHFYTGQRNKVPDSPVKYQTPSNSIARLGEK